MTGLYTRSFVTDEGKKTTIGLEKEFWDSLEQIASEQGCDMRELVWSICTEENGNRARNLRLFVLEHFKMKLSKLARKR